MDSLIPWLLDSSTPSIRYLTLRRLIGRGEQDADVQAARAAMRTTGPIPTILETQTSEGFWQGDPSYYGRKYSGTHWSMILLPELAADPDDPRLRRSVDFMLTATEKNYMLQDRFDQSVTSPAEYGFTCLWGNILRYAAYFGCASDPRVSPIVDYVARNQIDGGCRCQINGCLPCAWGVARVLWGLAALPTRTEAVESAIQQGLDFLLDPAYPLVAGGYPTPGKVHKLWAKLNFPLFYQADVLFTLRVLGELKALDRVGIQPALEWLEAQRQPNGHWRGVSPYGARTWPIKGDAEDTNRWVSLHAAIVLRQAEAQWQAA